MVKAEELRLKLKEKEQVLYDKQLDKILSKIEEAVNHNMYSIVYKNIMCDAVRIRLRDDGFDINTKIDGRNNPIYLISWE